MTWTEIQRLMADLEAKVEAIERASTPADDYAYQGCDTCGSVWLGRASDRCPRCRSKWDSPAAKPGLVH
jgi:rubrerythrin